MTRYGLRHSLGSIAPDPASRQGVAALCLIGWAVAASVFVLLDSASPYRSLVTLSFLLLAPGLAFVRQLRLQDRVLAVSLAVGLSLALDALVATLVLYANAWSFRSIFLLLACFTVSCALVELIGVHNRLIKDAAPSASVWRLRVGLVVACLVGVGLATMLLVDLVRQVQSNN